MSLKKNLRGLRGQAMIEYIIGFIAFALVVTAFVTQVGGYFENHFQGIRARIVN